MDLTQPPVLRALLDRHGIEARKGLGQHFLCSSSVVDKIRAALHGVESALEIGPGPGVLTAMLCEACRQVAAIELDSRMASALAESAPCARVLQEDALQADLPSILALLVPPRAVVSNLPYYITGPLLTRIAFARSEYERAILMMQREVADRVLAGPGEPERGSLSVFLQLQFELSKVADVPAGAFLPPPKVASAVLRFDPKPAAPPAGHPVYDLVRAGFRHPRKTLANNFSVALAVPRDQAVAWLGPLDPRIRPQQLSNDDWLGVAEARRADGTA